MASPAEAPSSAAPSFPELEIEKLHALPSEQQDLYLLTFTSDLARYVAGLDADGATKHQAAVKKELFKVIELPSPAPTRVIRKNLGHSFAGILGKGDRKVLYESVNELLAIVNTGKGPKDSTNKHAAVHCLGSVFATAGDSATSLSTVACTSLLRILKPAQNHTGLRAALFKTLGHVYAGVGRSVDETTAREVWKQARSSAINEKASLVQSAACFCIEKLFQHTPYFDNSNDFEKLQQTVWKVIDTPSLVLRRAAASCMSTIQVKYYSKAGLEPKAKKPKKAKPAPDGDRVNGDADVRTSSPAPQASTISFGLIDILRQQSMQYCRSTSSNRVRAGMIAICANTLTALGDRVVEEHYNEIATHFFNDMLSSMSVTHNRYRLLITYKFIRLVLSNLIGRKMLGETAQLNAVRFLVNGVLKDYPQSDVKERPEPRKQALVAALDALASLIECLGSAAHAVGDLCRGAILQVIEHPSYTVQTHASRCLQALVLACPSQLLSCVTICMNSVNREVNLLASSQKASPRRCLGFAFGLAATISTSSSQPLYGSVDVYSRIFTQATSILKSSSGSDIRVSSVQIQVAWILIGGLMSLGPNFVKIHLSQLLLLWRNALPKPLGSDNIGQRSLLELSFLAHVRDCALSSIRAFLSFNARLLTLDVSKRLAVMLQNTTTFLTSLPQRKLTDDIGGRLSPSLQLLDYDLMVRRRVFQCYAELLSLSPSESHDSLLQSSVLSLAVSSFAEPDLQMQASLSSAIATTLGNFDSPWEVGDNSGFGITSLVRGLDIATNAAGEGTNPDGSNLEMEMDRTIKTPICAAIEHDVLQMCSSSRSHFSPPLGTGVVDAAIRLFAVSLPLQSARVQQGALEQISSMLISGASQQTPAREVTLDINVGAALLFALDNATKEMSSTGNLRSSEVEKAIQELLHAFLAHHEVSVRHLAAEAVGHLCRSSGTDFTNREVAYLVDRIVSNPEPNLRSGAAMALGSITAELGGMAAGLHLKNILGILSSLASDPHPTVHFWALDAVSKIADATGLSFSGHVSSTLGLLAQLYVAESHGEETSSLATSNIEADQPSLNVVAKCIDSMINVLGPDLQDMTKTRNMILTLTYQFQTESSHMVAVQSLRCLENLSMYAPGHISFKPYVRQLQSKIVSDEPDVQLTALTGLYNAMRRDAEEVLSNGEDHLEDQMWLVLHDTYGVGIMRSIISNWVQQSGVQKIDIWVPRIQKVLKTVRSQAVDMPKDNGTASTAEPDLQDEEVAGFAAAASQTAKDDPSQLSEASQELLRWQARSTAMECLNTILSSVAKDASVDSESPSIAALQPRVADIVRIAFSASTASVVELRVQGVQIIGRVLEIFGHVPDPDFPEATLLEQYQAQISSALTPAFAADSSPNLAAEAAGVCASFITTGIVTNADRMGRILKLLVSALEDFSKESETAAIGDLKNLSSNAQIMVKLAVYSAWAELQIASSEQTYLQDIVKPHLAKLVPLWLSSLREYARLKFEPDGSGTLSSGNSNETLDVIYAALSRETLLTFYQASWLKFVDAIANLIDQDSQLVFDALDEKSSEAVENGEKATKGQDINYRHEPVAFFFVLFGISFEALTGRSGDDSVAAHRRTLDILQALKKIVSPAVAGLAIYQEAIFTETMDLLDRIVLTEGLEVQRVIVEIARSMCRNHPSARRTQQPSEAEEQLSDDIEQLFELTRIIVLVIAKHVPNLGETAGFSRPQLDSETVSLIALALTALVDAAEVFPSVIKSDLHACILHIFATILSNGACQATAVPTALPIFRRFATSLAKNPQHETSTQLRSALSRVLTVIKHAQKRESEAALPAEKNNLLAGTILLTAAARIFPPKDPLVTRFVDEVADCLTNAMTTKVSAGLSRSLLLLPAASTSPSATEAHISAQMLPHLLSFLLTPSDIEGVSETRSLVAQILTAFCSALPDRQRPAAVTVVVQTLLERADREGEKLWPETSARLLDLARRDGAAFRLVVGGMAPAQRALVEKIIRQGGGMAGANGQGRQAQAEEENKEPSIALKLDF